MKFAVAEKDRLEIKQRLLMRYMEQKKINHVPVYFEEYKNSLEKDEIYYKYNHFHFKVQKISKIILIMDS